MEEGLWSNHLIAQQVSAGVDPALVGLVCLGLLVMTVVAWRWARSRTGKPGVAAVSSGAGHEEPQSSSRLHEAMRRTREHLGRLFRGATEGPDPLEAYEEALIMADVGLPTAQRLLLPIREALGAGQEDPEHLQSLVVDEMRRILLESHQPFALGEGLQVLMVVGVNGSGKTTTIGKLSARFAADGRRVLLAAGDTYRAAAGEQLEIWANRTGVDIVRHQEGADPGAVVYDALEAATARGCDVVIVDTAGRLQTRRPLMEQLSKICRVIEKKVPGAPHETLLVVDGTMGQNALSQAREFHAATPLTGVVVTKLDGTARGGVVVAITSELGLPVKWVGVGEQMDDLQDFDPERFVEALFG